MRTIDDDGGLELQSQIEGRAPVVQRVPVRAEGKDEDGTVIHMLLHVIEGRPVGLGFYRDGLGNVRKMPRPSAFELIVLPPKSERWLLCAEAGLIPVSDNPVSQDLGSNLWPSLKNQVEQILRFILSSCTPQDRLMASFRVQFCYLSLTVFHRSVSQPVQHPGIVGL